MKNLLLLLMLVAVACTSNRKPIIEPAKPTVKPSETKQVYSYRSSLKWVKELSEKANCVINHPETQKAIKTIDKFKENDPSIIRVAEQQILLENLVEYL